MSFLIATDVAELGNQGMRRHPAAQVDLPRAPACGEFRGIHGNTRAARRVMASHAPGTLLSQFRVCLKNAKIRSSCFVREIRQGVARAHYDKPGPIEDMGVDHCRLDIGVAE